MAFPITRPILLIIIPLKQTNLISIVPHLQTLILSLRTPLIEHPQQPRRDLSASPDRPNQNITTPWLFDAGRAGILVDIIAAIAVDAVVILPEMFTSLRFILHIHLPVTLQLVAAMCKFAAFLVDTVTCLNILLAQFRLLFVKMASLLRIDTAIGAPRWQ